MKIYIIQIKFWLSHHFKISPKTVIKNGILYEHYIQCKCEICFEKDQVKLSRRNFIRSIKYILDNDQDFKFMKFGRNNKDGPHLKGAEYKNNHNNSH